MKLKFKKAFEAMEAAKSAAEPKSNHRILIVDDEAPNLESLRDILGRSYPVTTCLRAGEALEKIAAGEEYSVIISDYMMPEMSGVEFFKELKQRQHSAPRIMVTGFAALDNVIAAINDGGVFQYVTKPVRPEQLELGRKRSGRPPRDEGRERQIALVGQRATGAQLRARQGCPIARG